MIDSTTVVDWRLFGAVAVALICFGFAFNAWVDTLAERKEGYTALLVALGVAVTLAGVALISWQAALLTIIFFACSGTPMILGDILRTVRAREQALAEQRARLERLAEDIRE